jgi:predicted RNA-binding protein with PUA-like domain
MKNFLPALGSRDFCGMNYWLMKSEPDVYSIDTLQSHGSTIWDGVRNYQARNFLKSMAVGDRAFFYHSNATPPGIVGLMEVIEAMVIDPSQFDPEGEYYDPKATLGNPRWHTVRVSYLQHSLVFLSLALLREAFTGEELAVVKQGNRLSVLPVPLQTAERILTMAFSKDLKNCE